MSKLLPALLFFLSSGLAQAGLFRDCGEFALRGQVTPGTSSESFDLIVAPGTRSETRIALKNSLALAPYSRLNVKVRVKLEKACAKSCAGEMIQFLALLEPDEDIADDISGDLQPTRRAKCAR